MTAKAYKDSGVDIDAGAELVQRIKPFAQSTDRPGVRGSLGGFGGLFDPKAAGYKDPILVAATDGVGTKLKVAIESGLHDTVGIDLVAMCVNDLIVQGAEPLFFLDYFATGKLDVDMATDVVQGIAEGCELAGCGLIGGETAEMPGMYHSGDYDLAGFAVGAAERGTLLDGRYIEEGDVVIGLASNGLHSNGFSLVRKIIEDKGLSYADNSPFEKHRTLGMSLLEPTRIYIKSLLPALRDIGGIRGLSHITGGGLLENIPRVLPDGLAAELDATMWKLLPVFRWLRDNADLGIDDMIQTFNCGIGMAVICEAEASEILLKHFRKMDEKAAVIGQVTKSNSETERVIIHNAQEAWG